jgi:hypothetical protein
LVEVSSALAEYHLLAEDYPLAQHYARQVLSGRSGDLREEVPALAIMVHSAIWQGDLDSAQRSLIPISCAGTIFWCGRTDVFPAEDL